MSNAGRNITQRSITGNFVEDIANGIPPCPLAPTARDDQHVGLSGTSSNVRLPPRLPPSDVPSPATGAASPCGRAGSFIPGRVRRGSYCCCDLANQLRQRQSSGCIERINAKSVRAWDGQFQLPEGNKSMSDKAEGAAADAGATVQEKLNQAGEAQDQLVQFVRDNPISAALLFVGIGYVLGKII